MNAFLQYRAAFLQALEDFRTDSACIGLDESSQYASEFADLLATLLKRAPAKDKSLSRFCSADQEIMGRADDSLGQVGGVFSEEAVELFVRYAARSGEKGEVIDLLDDSYGIRGALAEVVNRFLSPDELSLLSDKCREKAESVTDPSRRSHWLSYSEVASEHLKA